jgi:hypothetical protein
MLNSSELCIKSLGGGDLKLLSHQNHSVQENKMGSLEFPKTEKPWVETPLIESKALSRAAGWYDNNSKMIHTYSLLIHFNQQSRLPQTRKSSTFRLLQITVLFPLHVMQAIFLSHTSYYTFN